MKRPLVFGEVLFDVFQTGEQVLGGAPFNVAYHLAGFGTRPVFVSRVGDDERGQAVVDFMSSWGMDVDGVQFDEQIKTGEVSVRIEDGEPEFQILPEQAYDYISADELPSVSRSEVALIYSGTLALRGITSRKTLDSLELSLEVPRFLDVNLRSPWWTERLILERVAKATWLKVNRYELGVIASITGVSSSEVEKEAEALQQHLRLRAIAVTLGEQGAVLVTEDGQLIRQQIPESEKAIVDTVGAGDAFSAAMIEGLIAGREWCQTLKNCVTLATAVCRIRGALPGDLELYQVG